MELLQVSAGGFTLLRVLSAPVMGTPILGWQLVLVLFVLYRLFGGLLGGGGGRRVAASHILVKEESTCMSIKAELDAASADGAQAVGSLFADLARKHSICPSGNQSGGDLGKFGKGQMVPEFDAVCWTAPVGQVQGPVQTGFGSHLILVTERDPEPGATPEPDKEK